MIHFTDEDLRRFPAEYTEMPKEKIVALVARLEACEEIAKATEMAHPEDENCGCSMCDALAVWKELCRR